MTPTSRHDPFHLRPLEHPPAFPPILLGRIKRPVRRFQQPLVVGGGADSAARSTDADGDVAVAVAGVVMADADPATAMRMRSKPVAVS
ncbi:hypothetical protein [Rhizobium glycinendophyticum]|uniref:hypothetical protein n=1 Tax=Rhizobium glycinendophyticum TaxID=2589807 RepID=UPI003CCC6D2D